VNYNRNAGRGRDYLESIGMLWFMNYKIRIMKIAIRTMRDTLALYYFTKGINRSRPPRSATKRAPHSEKCVLSHIKGRPSALSI